MDRKEYNREYYKKNKGLLCEKSLEKYELRKDENKKRMRKYYSENREKLTSDKRRFYQENKERVKEQGKRHYENNKKNIIKKGIEYNKKRRVTDDIYRTTHNIRRRIRLFINHEGSKKNKNTEQLVGCSWDYLMDYLYSIGYKEGLHLDHYIPLSVFDVFNEDHKKIMFNYRNLQPITKSENSKKGSSLPNDWESYLSEICYSVSIEKNKIIKYITEHNVDN